LKEITRKQLSWINKRHVTEEKLNKAITKIINEYRNFELLKFWGSGKTASADGMKWELYEQNLLTEYHIRYGGYGGIGYYHISDTYIVLFSNFIPCGVHEGIHILDIFREDLKVNPDTLHGDSHAQSEVIFGLSYLLGIKLMPRIKRWKHLKFYRVAGSKYRNIEDIFSDEIDLDFIIKHLPDMYRVALSIKEGRITASAILRRLGNYSRQNKLYKAFRELGRLVRTGFLLQYLGDKDFRDMIQAATCKSESYNYFTQWVSFGSRGIATENNRDEQRKMLKYNHLIANCVCFYNVYTINEILNDLVNEGVQFEKDALEHLSPYITRYINRFGDYNLNLDKEIPELNYRMPVL
jgi:Transposase and inactivated derivatives, TnpA family